MIEIKIANNLEDLNKCFSIRQEIFIEEQGWSIFTIFDENFKKEALNFLATKEENAIGTATLLTKSSKTIKINPKEGFIPLFGILKEYRSKGYGSQLLKRVIRHAKNTGLRKLELCSQLQAKEFYENQGFKTHGDIYIQENIPHIRMYLTI